MPPVQLDSRAFLALNFGSKLTHVSPFQRNVYVFLALENFVLIDIDFWLANRHCLARMRVPKMVKNGLQ
jgi:hypothetical protein